jgi:hypothetical protein
MKLYYEEFSKLFPEAKLTMDKDQLSNYAYHVDDWNKDTCRLVANFLCGCFIFRQTGRIIAWEGVLEYRRQVQKVVSLNKTKALGFNTKSKVCLPTQHTYRDVIAYLEHSDQSRTGSLADFRTQQHQGAIHEEFKKSVGARKNLCNTIERMFKPREALDSIAAYLECQKGKIKRHVLRGVMGKAFAACIEGCRDPDNAQLMQIMHQTIADVERFLPDFAGEVTIESIATGYGSQFGLRVLFSKKSGMDDEKYRYLLKLFHEELTATMQAMSDTALFCLGYKKRSDGTIVSVFNGRKRSYTDTEHLCCKLYICIVLTHPSRTVSDSPNTHSHFAWPLPPHPRGDDTGGDDPRAFVHDARKVFAEINKRLCTEDGLDLLTRYPQCLEFRHADYFQDS